MLLIRVQTTLNHIQFVKTTVPVHLSKTIFFALGTGTCRFSTVQKKCKQTSLKCVQIVWLNFWKVGALICVKSVTIQTFSGKKSSTTSEIQNIVCLKSTYVKKIITPCILPRIFLFLPCISVLLPFSSSCVPAFFEHPIKIIKILQIFLIVVSLWHQSRALQMKQAVEHSTKVILVCFQTNIIPKCSNRTSFHYNDTCNDLV